VIKHEAVALKESTVKLNLVILEKLIKAHKEKRTEKWKVLPGGYEVWRIKAPRPVGDHFVVILYEKKMLGYILVNKVLIQSKPKLRGWMITQSYLLPEARGVGLMNRLYNLVIDSGRLIASPVMTSAAMKMWIGRIKTDQRHIYAVYDAKQSFIHVDSRLINFMKTSIWDGSAKTILVAFQKTDPIIKKLIPNL
jgi:hypothetical protein